MTHRTRAFCAAPISSAKQTGIRQRSLRKQCRLGRATELVFITALGTAVMIGGGAAAQTATWTGNDSTNFTAAGNYTGGNPAGQNVVINTAPANLPRLEGGDSISINALSVSAGTLTVNGELTAGGGTNISGGVVSVGSGGGTLISNVTLTGGALSTNGTISGNITNGGTLAINSQGRIEGNLSSSGTGTNNAFSAGFGINGTLGVTGGTFTNSGIVTGATSVSGGTLTLSSGSNLADGAALNISAGIVNVNTADTVGSVAVSGGAMNVNAALAASSGVNITGGAVVINSGRQITGNVTVNGGSLNNIGTVGGTLTVESGTATVQNLATVNGETTVNGGELTVASGGSLGSLQPLIVNGGNVNVQGNLTVGALAGSGGSIGISASQVLTTNGNNASTTFGGVISGAGAVAKRGTGTLTLSGANTYTGDTQITEGTLDVTGSIASSTITLNGGTRLIVDGNAISDTARVRVNDGTLELRGNERVGNVLGAIPGSIVLGASTLTLSSGNSIFEGTISGTGGLTVTGSDHSFGGTNSFTGAINITGGRGTFNGTSSTAVNVSSNGELTGILNTGANLSLSGAGRFRNGNTQTIASLTQSGLSNLQGDRDLTITGAYDLSGGSVTNTATISAGSFTMSGGSISAGARVNSAGAKNLSGGAIYGTLGGTGNTTVTGAVGLLGTLAGGTTTLASSGRLNVSSTGTISSNLAFTGGQLHATGNSTLAFGNLTVGDGQTGVISSADGRTLTMVDLSSVTRESGSTLTFGEAGGTGVVEIQMPNVGASFSTQGTAQAQIAGGTVRLGTSFTALNLLKFGSTAINSGATLDMNGLNTEVSDLSGAGTVTSGVGGARVLSLQSSSGTTSNFSGQITDGAGAISVEKTGRGTMIFSGTNTYTDTTTISQGTLQIGDGGTTGSLGAGNVVNNATLTFNRSDEMTVANVISGTGGITQAGSGTTILSGNNSFNGVTNVNAGTLRVTHGNALGSTSGGTVVANGAALEVSGGVTTAENLTLSGTGAGGVGALRNISGTNVLSGAITLAGDTLLHNNTGSFTTGSLYLNGGISGAGHDLSFSGNSLFVINGNINTGTGGIIKSGTGRVALAGTNSFTGDVVINQGDLWVQNNNALADTVLVRVNSGATFRVTGDETVGNVSGAGNVDIGVLGSSAFLTLGDATNTEISGVISGSRGTLTKQGSGTLTLSGANTFETLAINAGRVAVNGSVTAATTVNSGGTLSGTGQMQGIVTVNSGGTLAAGNSIGTLNAVWVTLESGSILEVEVDPSDAARADLINVAGNFTINGATLRHVGEAGTYVPDRTWRIVNTTGTVSGTFGTVTSDYTFLTPTAIYGANFVDLRLTRNDVSFESIARTRNQRATAGGISTIAGSQVSNTLVTLSGDAARNALDQFSGAGLAAIGSGQLGEGQGMANTLAGQMGGAGGGIVTASSRGTGGAPARLWANLYGTGASRDMDGITTDLRNGGVMIGHDLEFGAWQGGVMVGFGQSRTDTGSLRTTSKTDSFSLGTYAARSFGEMDVNLGLIATWGDVQSTRSVAVGPLNQTLQARYSTRMLTGFGEVARRFEGAVWSATPFARITQQWLQNDGFAETGGTAALTRAAQTTNQTLLTLGGEVERDLGIGTLSANLAVTQSFGAGAQATYRLGNSTPFTIEGDAARDTSVDLGLGYDITLSNAATLSLTAGTTRQGETSTRRIGVNLGMRF